MLEGGEDPPEQGRVPAAGPARGAPPRPAPADGAGAAGEGGGGVGGGQGGARRAGGRVGQGGGERRPRLHEQPLALPVREVRPPRRAAERGEDEPGRGVRPHPSRRRPDRHRAPPASLAPAAGICTSSYILVFHIIRRLSFE